MQKREEIIKRLLDRSAEVITPEEFTARLTSGDPLTHYIGFEISGYVHIGQGIMSALVMKDLTDLGVKCTIWLADWHTWINDKLDGTKETAARIGQGYFTEAIKACFLAVGGNPDDLEFRLASDWYEKAGVEYLELEKRIEKEVTLARMQRSISIAGRQEDEEVSFATLTYPAMQVADIFLQNIDIVHAGMDQRKAHVVMRDVADKIRPKRPKPVVIHHPLLPSLSGKVVISKSNFIDREEIMEFVKDPMGRLAPEELAEKSKMSKSDPSSAIVIHDTPEDIERKIKKAFCQEKNIEQNPILNWTKNILFWSASRRTQQPFVIERKPEHGGMVEFSTYDELATAFAAGEVHPMDLKATVAKELIALLAPVREHFTDPQHAAQKEELDKVLANR